MKNILYYMLEHPKALSTHHSYDSENLKDSTMDNQQETKKITNKQNKNKNKQTTKQQKKQQNNKQTTKQQKNNKTTNYILSNLSYLKILLILDIKQINYY